MDNLLLVIRKFIISFDKCSVDGDIGWLFVPGEGKTNVKVDEKQMSIYLADTLAKTFEIVIYSRNNSPELYQKNNWVLSPMQLKVKTGLNRKDASVLSPEEGQALIETSAYYPNLIKIVFEIPSGWNIQDPLLTIIPRYINEVN